MAYRDATGLILQRRDVFEEDRQISFLTPEYGGLTVLAHHAQTSQKTYCGRLEPPNRIQARIYRPREDSTWSLSEVSIDSPYADLFHDDTRRHLWPLLALHRDLIEAGTEAQAPYHRLDRGLALLREGFEPERLVVVRILARLAVTEGLELPFERCVHCGDTPSEPAFVALDHGVVCGQCRNTAEGDLVRLEPGVLSFFQQVRDLPWEELLDRSVTGNVLAETESLLYRLFHYHFSISTDALNVRNQL